MRALACAGLLVLLTAGSAFADQSHVVRPGETLWSIATQHGTSVEAIARANNLNNRHLLQPGQRLIIPTTGTPSVPRPAAERRTVTYTIKAGDTLWAVAQRYDMSVQEIARLNDIAVDAPLQIGQALKVRAPRQADVAAAPRSAPLPARRVGTLPYRGEAWANSLIGLARRFMGTRYRWGATGPSAFDCSGFLQYVYARLGVTLPRTTFAMFQAGRPVPSAELLPGDMVFFTTYRPGPSHAGIYIGNGLFIHSSSGYGSVTITPLSKDYYQKRYLGARRF
jgi:cell wall-associated NlpC family hydrolase